MGSSFSWWGFKSKTIGWCPTASRHPAGTRERLFSRSNFRRWDTGLPWHEARDSLTFGWGRTISPCQKDNCKRKTHLDRFLGNSRDRTRSMTPGRWHIRFAILLWRSAKCWVHSLRKCSKIPKNSQTLDFDSYGQCNGSHGKGRPREIGYSPIQTHTTATV
jgi:hypothetical protein